MTATVLDVRFLAKAKQMIDKYGKAVTFYPVTDDVDGSAYDTTTGTETAADGVAVPTKCVIAVVGKTSRRGQDIPREGVRQADHLIYVPAADFAVAPKSQDRMVMDGTSWQVLSIEYFYSGENAAMYGVYIKKP